MAQLVSFSDSSLSDSIDSESISFFLASFNIASIVRKWPIEDGICIKWGGEWQYSHFQFNDNKIKNLTRWKSEF